MPFNPDICFLGALTYAIQFVGLERDNDVRVLRPENDVAVLSCMDPCRMVFLSCRVLPAFGIVG